MQATTTKMVQMPNGDDLAVRLVPVTLGSSDGSAWAWAVRVPEFPELDEMFSTEAEANAAFTTIDDDVVGAWLEVADWSPYDNGD